MATKVIMPKQGLQMTEGTITRWLVPEGGQAEQDQPLFEMETDKLTIEIMAPASGTLLKVLYAEGETIPITETIAIIGEPGEDIAPLLADSKAATGAGETETKAATEPATADRTALSAAAVTGATAEATASAAGEKVYVTPRARTKAVEAGIDPNRIAGSGPEGLVIERDVLAAASLAPKATPVARRIAELNEVDLAAVAGGGPGGKIMKADVQAVLARPEARQTAAAAFVATGGAHGGRAERGERLMPMSGMRKVIAERMFTSLQTMAQANHRMKVDMSEIIRFREKLKAADIKVSFTDIIVRCVTMALKDFPIVNASLTEQGILYKDYVNMGIAVAVENGLLVPVIKDADLMNLAEIAAASAELIAKAQNGTLAPDDYTGGTFTITNLGMFDIDEFTAIVNPPESAILAIGKIDRVPVAVGEEVVIRPIMTLSLSYDHRTIDGAPAAQFLQRVKQILQNPYLLI